MTFRFSNAELVARSDRARTLMDKANLDALLVTGDFSAGMNYYYLSGHLPRDYQLNFSRPHVMVLPREGDAFLLVYAVNEENAREMSWVEDVNAYAPPFTGGALAEAMRERGLGSARIGAELGVDQRILMPIAEFDALRAALPDARFVDGADVLWDLRMIKGTEEVELIRVADSINDLALRRTFETVRGGDSEADVARAFGSALVDAGAVRPPYGQVLIMSQAKSRELGHRARMLGPSCGTHTRAGGSPVHRLGRGRVRLLG